MKKIGKLFLQSIFLFFLHTCVVFGQSPSVSATINENNIFLGESLRLTITIQGQNVDDIPRPELPAINGVRWLRNRTSTSTSYSIINGKASASYSYSYILIAESPGTYTIPPIKINIEGENLSTDPISFTITDRSTLPDSDPDKIPDIFVEMEIDDENPVPGQQLVASLVLYFKEGIEVATYQPSPGWKAEGFWKEELSGIQRPKASSVIKNGIRLRKATLMQYALFPTKSGTLTLSPFTVTVTVRTQRSRDPFNFDVFSFGGNQQRIQIETKPVDIEVRPLPRITDAIYFGGVGDFTVKRVVTPTEALVGESIEVKTTITGYGNIPLLTKPEFELPEGLEKYQPEENSTINRNGTQISGTKTFSDIIIARNAGEFIVPQATVASFNPETNNYDKTVLPAITLKIQRDPNSISNPLAETRLSIQPVTGLVTWQKNTSVNSFFSGAAWILLILPLFVFSGGYWKSRYEKRLKSDLAFARSEKAYDRAMEILETIHDEIEIKKAYHIIHKAVTGFIGDKLNLDQAGLHDSEYIDALKSKKVNQELIKRTQKLLDTCSSISFAPNINQKGLSQKLQESKELIKQLRKEI